MARTKIDKSTGNVFRDVGFSPEEAASLKIRADLMIEISGIIKRRKLTQAAAAKLLGVTQPRVSDLVRGKIDLFSIDTLVDMISRAGGTVQLAVRGTKKAA
jgi:predicted XRE-type DNA-binding protein